MALHPEWDAPSHQHALHRSCLKTFLEHAEKNDYKALCPVCKKVIDKLVSDELFMSRFHYLACHADWSRAGVTDEFECLMSEATEDDLLAALYHAIRYGRTDAYLCLMSTAKVKLIDAIKMCRYCPLEVSKIKDLEGNFSLVFLAVYYKRTEILEHLLNLDSKAIDLVLHLSSH